MWEREYDTGDWGGLRTSLADRGVIFNFTYTADGFGSSPAASATKPASSITLMISRTLTTSRSRTWGHRSPPRSRVIAARTTRAI